MGPNAGPNGGALMFGMIHRSARAMVIEQFGTAAWDQILQATKLDDGDFVSAQSYSDETTLGLIGTAAATAGLTVDQTLLAFGHHWVRTADQGVYANGMAVLGGSVLEALENLDRMHASIQIALPDAQLPQFAIVSANEESILLAYYSKRVGLESFVSGLLEGLLIRFNQPGSVAFTGTDGPARLFTVTFDAPAAAQAWT